MWECDVCKTFNVPLQSECIECTATRRVIRAPIGRHAEQDSWVKHLSSCDDDDDRFVVSEKESVYHRVNMQVYKYDIYCLNLNLFIGVCLGSR
jgi:hypothetical protein